MQSPCKLCNATILWATDASGAPVPLDPVPSDAGELAVVNGRVLGAFHPNHQFWSGARYLHHAATCAALKEAKTPTAQ